MASLNKVQLIGNLTRDVEVRYTPRGAAVADISIAVNRKWKDDQGNANEEVTYVDLVAWGKTAELAGQYLSKGSSVFFGGRLQLESWEDKATGQKRSRMRVVVEEMQFLGGKQEAQQPRRQASKPQRQAPPPPDDDFGSDPGDDEIPF